MLMSQARILRFEVRAGAAHLEILSFSFLHIWSAIFHYKGFSFVLRPSLG